MRKTILTTVFLGFLLATSVRAGTFFNDFSSPALTGFQLNGGTRPAPNDTLNYPAIENGYLAITYAETGEQGAIILDDLDAGGQIESLVLTCKLLMGGAGATARPADGMSFNFAPDLADGSVFGEEGSGNGLSICFDVWDNGAPDRIAFDVKTPQDDGTGTLAPTIVASKPMPDDSGGNGNSFLKTGTNFVDLRIEMKRNGQLDLTFKGSNIFSGVFVEGWQPLQGRFGIGARTGGAWQNQWIDDLRITTVPYSGTPVAPTILTQPQNLSINERDPATFSVVPDGTPPFSYQWFSNSVPISGATNRVYSIAAASATQNGAKYKVQVTNAANNITSSEATLTVVTDVTPPTLTKVFGSDTFTDVMVVFSEPVTTTSAQATGNYGLSGGLTISAASLIASNVVKLTTSQQTSGTKYTLTVNRIQDQAATANTIAPNTMLTFTALVLARGGALHKFFDNITVNTLDTLTSDPRFPNNPTFTTIEPRFEYPPNGGNEAGENYGNQLSALLLPPVTGDYIFYVNSDDPSELYLSTDENPANKQMICNEPQWGSARLWITSDNQVSRGDPPSNISAPIHLDASKRYYIEAIHTEGGGGDNVGATWLIPGAPPVKNGDPPIAGQYLAVYMNPDGVTLTITQQPQDLTVPENTSASFSVRATGTSDIGTNVNYQWQRNGVDIAGANNPDYLIPLVKAATDNGAAFSAIASLSANYVTSRVATLTVTVDTTPPALVSARRSFTNDSRVIVVFSEPVTQATANTPTNYKINNGVTVSAAALGADGKTVELTTSPIAKGTSNTLTVNGIRDTANNLIATDAQIAIIIQRGALFVLNNTDPPTVNPSDGLVQSRLESRGYYVELVGSIVDDVSMATGKDIVVLSSTFSSANVTDTYKNVPVPVLDWEQAVQDDMAMTTVGGTTDRGTTTGLTDIEIVNAAHPMAAGLSAGVHTVVTAPSEFAWGQPNTNAQVVAVLVGTTNACIYGYDKGALLTDGTPAAERRVLFLMSDNVAVNLNADGLKLFDAAVDWAQNLTSTTPTVPVITKVNLIPGNKVHIEWTGGGTLEVSDKVTGGTWTDTGLTSPVDALIDQVTRFARVKRVP